jgi:hypothetical protein
MPIFGITASSNQTVKQTDFYQIATTTVGSGTSAQIVFNSIPQIYTHLQLRGIKANTFGGSSGCNFTFNNDTAANYASHLLYSDTNTVYSFAGPNGSALPLGNNSGGSSYFGMFVVDILDYRNTNKFKTVRYFSGYQTSGGSEIENGSGLWRSTSAVNEIRINAATYNFRQYSSFQLYGVMA